MKIYLVHKNQKIDLGDKESKDSLPRSVCTDVMKSTKLESVIPKKEFFLELIENKNYSEAINLISSYSNISRRRAKVRLVKFVLVFGMCCLAKRPFNEFWTIMGELAEVISAIKTPLRKALWQMDILNMFHKEGLVVCDEEDLKRGLKRIVFEHKVRLLKKRIRCNFFYKKSFQPELDRKCSTA